MSRETMTTLNTNVLVGNTDARGHAWHYRAEEQGEENNHYAGHIPVADVQRRLFHWDAVEAPLQVLLPADAESATTWDADGNLKRATTIEGKKAIVRSDTGAVMGIFGTETYQVHQYREWLLGAVSNILGGNLGISSAGLLKGGAVAWIEVSVPETCSTKTGFAFRPNLLAATSHDGSLATTTKRTITATVCDNTLTAALGESGQQFKVKHSAKSMARLSDARAALNIVEQTAESFTNEVDALVAITVSDKQWADFLTTIAPTDEVTSARSVTMAEHKRETLTSLWNADERVNPWKNTAFGVLQAVNTYAHHESIVRNVNRAERNMLNSLTGKVDAMDQGTVALLAKVLDRPLLVG